MSNASEVETFTTDPSGSVRTARVGQHRADTTEVADYALVANDDQPTSTPTLPTRIRVAIYAIGTPVAAAAMFVAGSAVPETVRIVAGAIGAGAVAAVGTTALGNVKR